jgi:hypothetical protein
MADDHVEAISRRMAELRCALTGDVHAVSRSARVMTDWTFYVRRFPWATVAIAAVAGYLLVPKKKNIISPDQETLAQMVRKHQLRLDVDHKAEKPGAAKSLLALAAMWAAKAGIGYVGELMRSAAVHKAHESVRPEPTVTTVH